MNQPEVLLPSQASCQCLGSGQGPRGAGPPSYAKTSSYTATRALRGGPRARGGGLEVGGLRDKRKRGAGQRGAGDFAGAVRGRVRHRNGAV